jgi:hypothetical protein
VLFVVEPEIDEAPKVAPPEVDEALDVATPLPSEALAGVLEEEPPQPTVMNASASATS